jgi:hypothetical protein
MEYLLLEIDLISLVHRKSFISIIQIQNLISRQGRRYEGYGLLPVCLSQARSAGDKN